MTIILGGELDLEVEVDEYTYFCGCFWLKEPGVAILGLPEQVITN